MGGIDARYAISRVAYAFQGLTDPQRERLERVVLDTVLDQLAR